LSQIEGQSVRHHPNPENALRIRIADLEAPPDVQERIVSCYYHYRLGDLWRLVSRALRLSESHACTAGISPHSLGGDRSEIIRDILRVLDSKGRVVLCPNRAGVHFDVNEWQPSLPTRRQWKTGPFRRIAWQFDGITFAEEKNPPTKDVQDILRFCLDNDIDTIQLGKHLGIERCIEELLSCDFFVGCASGLAELCYSVGIPVYILQYRLPDQLIQCWQGGKARRIFQDAGAFLADWTWIQSEVRGLAAQTGCDAVKPHQSIATSLPERIGVLTAYNDDIAEMGRLAEQNHRRYCLCHGYSFVCETSGFDTSRKPPWSKILFLRKHLPRFDWMLWLDADTLIMNPATPLHSFLADDVDLIISEDWNGINAGVFFMRHTPWSLDFLQRIWNQTDFNNHGWLEQAAMRHLLSISASDRQHVRVVPHTQFNTYLPDYREGDFLLHFAGIPKRLSLMREYSS
jgi:hypothetical protein